MVANPHREWIDWTQPLAPAAARYLIEHIASSSGGLCSLEDSICVVPGRRSGRLLLESLLRECEKRDVSLLPPRFITPGSLPEVLCGHVLPQAVASADESRFAWVRALQTCDPQSIQPLLPALRPVPHDLLGWHALAAMIQGLHEELGGAMLSFRDVAERAARLELFGETDRWSALAEVHRVYLETLSRSKLLDPHQARLNAVNAAARSTQEAISQVILIGVVELNTLQRASLAGSRTVTTIVHAPAEIQDAFEEFGCVVSERWAKREVTLADDQLIVADLPDDQAQAVLEWLATALRGTPVDEVSIGLGDETLGEPLERAADWAGIGLHRVEAATLSSTAPFRLLEAVRDWIEEERFASFAALLRHPDIEESLPNELTGAGEPIRDWITLLDRYFADHLHRRFSGDWLGDPTRRKQLKLVYDGICSLVEALRDRDELPLGSWIEPTLILLERIYFSNEEPPSRAGRCDVDSVEVCFAIRDRLESLTAMDPSLQPQCSAAAALTLFLDACADVPLSSKPEERQIEVLGWLELHLDLAPNLIVMGMNDGQVPKSHTSDPFLPNSLRKALGLHDSDSLYARDAYLLEAIAHSRDKLAIVTGRRRGGIGGGDPLVPSRLLYACSQDILPRRVLRLACEGNALRRATPFGAPASAVKTSFTVFQPPPDPCEIEEMSVTSFKHFLQCPYRWWLRTMQGLAATDDSALELDPASFGGLAHGVLDAFAADEGMRDCFDAEAIAQWLFERLTYLSKERFGHRPTPAIRVQIDRLHRRFEAFARFQAQCRTEGWRIVEHELAIRGVPLDIPGQAPIHIKGKIDRIDELQVGPTTRYRIIDYKSSEQVATPFEVHHGKRKCDPHHWVDLQLPLYRHLATHTGFSGEVALGYIVLPRDVDRVAFLPGEWTDEDHDAALECAREVVRKIRAGKFPMSDDVDTRFDEFANICQSTVRGRSGVVVAEGETTAERESR